VELMVVIVVLGILTAMIVPQFGSTYQDALLRSHGRQLLEAVNLAYSQAVTSGNPVRLRIDPGRGRFWLEERAEEGDGDFQRVAGLPGCEGEIDRRISLEVRAAREAMPRAADERPERGQEETGRGDLPSVTFRPDGTAQAREILIRDAEGQSLALRIDATTSRARLAPVERAQP